MAYDVIMHGNGDGKFKSETTPRKPTAREKFNFSWGLLAFMSDRHPNKTGQNWFTWRKVVAGLTTLTVLYAWAMKMGAD